MRLRASLFALLLLIAGRPALTGQAPARQSALSVQVSSPAVYNSKQTLTTTGGSGTGSITYSIGSSTACTVSGATLTVTHGSGDCSVTATKAADANYQSATSTAVKVIVQPASQNPLSVQVSSPATYNTQQTLTTTGGGGTGAVTYSTGSSTACTVSGSTLTITGGTGTCEVTATKAADADFQPATSTAVNVAVQRADQAALSVTVMSPAENGTQQTLTATGGSGTGELTFSASGATGVTACTVSSTTLTITSPTGNCWVTATKAGDANYNSESSEAVPVVVWPAQLRLSPNDKFNEACQIRSKLRAYNKAGNDTEKDKVAQEFNSCVAAASGKNQHGSGFETLTSKVDFVSNTRTAQPGGGSGPAATPSQQISEGQQATQSAWASPDACSSTTTGAATGKGLLYVHRALVWPKQATDDFGYRLGRRFIVYQVSITNSSKDFEYEVGDIVVDLKPVLDRIRVPIIDTGSDESSKYALFQASSQDLSMLRGVPEKGQDYDPRNMTLHIFQGLGTVASSVSGLTPFSDVMGSAMSDFTGPFIQAFTGIAPDHTSTQLNRLSDMAFTSNTLIGKLQTKKFAIFIPEDFVMFRWSKRMYWDNPRQLLNILPFDQLNVCADGILLTQAKSTADPTFSPTDNLLAPNTPIAIADSESAATIYYSTDGSVPTTNSSKYTTAIPVGPLGGPTLTIKAFAVAANESPSNTVVGSFTPAIQAATLKYSCASGDKSAILAPTTPGDTVYFTTDGTAPSRGATAAPPASLTVPITSATEKIQAAEAGNNTSLGPVVQIVCPVPAPASPAPAPVP